MSYLKNILRKTNFVAINGNWKILFRYPRFWLFCPLANTRLNQRLYQLSSLKIKYYFKKKFQKIWFISSRALQKIYFKKPRFKVENPCSELGGSLENYFFLIHVCCSEWSFKKFFRFLCFWLSCPLKTIQKIKEMVFRRIKKIQVYDSDDPDTYILIKSIFIGS